MNVKLNYKLKKIIIKRKKNEYRRRIKESKIFRN